MDRLSSRLLKFEFGFVFGAPRTSLRSMATKGKPVISIARIVTDLMIVGPIYAFWVLILRPFVPLTETLWIWVGAAYTAVPLTGVCWMAYHMFRVVYEHEQAKKRSGE